MSGLHEFIQLKHFQLFMLQSDVCDNSVLIVHHAQAGAGGVDAMDWAEMLERMYLRWADKQGFRATITDRIRGWYLAQINQMSGVCIEVLLVAPIRQPAVW